MEKIKKLTILHSNDMHGDFLAENVDAHLIGGVSLLSGYVNKVRKEEKNVIYCIEFRSQKRYNKVYNKRIERSIQLCLRQKSYVHWDRPPIRRT